jgi:hypothetical protein
MEYWSIGEEMRTNELRLLLPRRERSNGVMEQLW